jgi:Manganese containing catalase
MGNPWNGSYVTATGNLKMDLLHNFFLECGARAGKSRVYEMAPDPGCIGFNRSVRALTRVSYQADGRACGCGHRDCEST